MFGFSHTALMHGTVDSPPQVKEKALNKDSLYKELNGELFDNLDLT